ncbi:TPA: hypothetical protein ACXDAY_002291 [Clostridium botulinum]|uniref:hypothetical protein n=1 Tax=Clostridium botulinum TaxID=1491 RepID=UPI0004653A6A|nr:hypothetical protein [Clostridium botulinum]APH20982.1 hypothetical protein NPD1_4080 [Clostridium botulinum]APQ71154.1 hypothetical protein RSJ8_4316 [Clostridium botulinum]APR02410.1 hypothetical protein RSJ2_4180 [Clostridium botulinum]MBN3359398.1 hypothetical protein [Clostridium botulinum]MBN3379104.1 hypothetical protein [Clostridium botulinum]
MNNSKIENYQNDWDRIQKVKDNLFKDLRIDSLINLRDTSKSEITKEKIQNIITNIGEAMNCVNDDLDDLQEELYNLEMEEHTKDWNAQEWSEYHMSCNNID